MEFPDVLDVVREAVWVTLKMSLPLLLIALFVGLAISLVQALTQIQEMTLSFVPKIVSVLLGLVFVFPFMYEILEAFTNGLFDRIAAVQ